MTRKIYLDEKREERERERDTGLREKLRLVSHGVLSTKFTHCHLGHGVNRRRKKERERRRGLRPRSARRKVWSGKGEKDGGVKREGGREKGRRKREKRENFREG